VNIDDLATAAARIMVEERINGVPVVGNGIMGILTGENIVKAIINL